MSSHVSRVALLLIAFSGVGCETGIAVSVALSGPGDTCDFFVETGIAIEVDVGARALSNQDATEWELDGREVRFRFDWPDGAADGATGTVVFDASTNQYLAHGEATFVVETDELVRVPMGAECSREVDPN